MRLAEVNKQLSLSSYGRLLHSLIIFIVLLGTTAGQNEFEKLPYCSENSAPGMLLVSTIDGKFSALNSEGNLQWQVDTGPGPLLLSNIHNLELTNSGKWIRIIPSLTGTLYRFDGVTIDPIPISADSLLKSSFKYSDDLVIAGGYEITTYGIGFRSGKIFYTCSSLKCTNHSNSESEVDDILILERNTQTVRAVDTQSGYERWNFSVGYHNIKLSQISCSDPLVNLFRWNVTAVIPDGILLASRYEDNVKTTWQYHFSSPIVRVWKWNGHKMTEIDLFQVRSEDPNETQISPAIYLGMHKKQLYIHESYRLQYKTEAGTKIAETSSLAKIPWKPIPAFRLSTEELHDDSTALSVLYSSEYVNGNGYYLYSENDVRKKNRGLCENNNTIRFPMLTQSTNPLNLGSFFLFWWKEILVILLTTAFLFNLLLKSFTRHQQKQRIIFVERQVEVPSKSNSSSDRTSQSSDVSTSRFLNDFDIRRCLGKGGFGVVFEVQQKIDECHYAIKRIVLPNEKSKRETVMREVKALAKLEHHNIVRYFNSWVEQPPYGWQKEQDNEWLKMANEFSTENTTTTPSLTSHRRTKNDYLLNHNMESDSYIVFEKSQSVSNRKNDTLKTLSKSDKNETVSYDECCPLEEVNCEDDKDNDLLEEVKITDRPPVFLYIQMQLCQKHSLKEWLIENKNRQFSEIIDIFKQILSAVEYVHMQGLIHRDLKPSNIFFSLDGQIKVGDFGLVTNEEESYDIQRMSDALKGHTKAVGTRLYMSPEQVNGQIYNYKVDIYSLGLIFFELLVYFSTDMERVNTLTKLRENQFPNEFMKQYTYEYNLLTMMLCHLPEKRLTTFGIRARPPISNCDNDYSEVYDFELPKYSKNVGQITLKS